LADAMAGLRVEMRAGESVAQRADLWALTPAASSAAKWDQKRVVSWAGLTAAVTAVCSAEKMVAARAARRAGSWAARSDAL